MQGLQNFSLILKGWGDYRGGGWGAECGLLCVTGINLRVLSLITGW